MDSSEVKEKKRNITHAAPYLLGGYLGYQAPGILTRSNKKHNLIKDIVALNEITKKERRIQTLGSISRLGSSILGLVIVPTVLQQIGVGDLIYK